MNVRGSVFSIPSGWRRKHQLQALRSKPASHPVGAVRVSGSSPEGLITLHKPRIRQRPSCLFPCPFERLIYNLDVDLHLSQKINESGLESGFGICRTYAIMRARYGLPKRLPALVNILNIVFNARESNGTLPRRSLTDLFPNFGEGRIRKTYSHSG